MIETLFALDRGNYRECQHLFRGEREQEYYRGDYWMEEGSVIDVEARRKPAGPARRSCCDRPPASSSAAPASISARMAPTSPSCGS